MATPGPGVPADGRAAPGKGSEGESAVRPGSNLRKRGAHVVSNSERSFVAGAVRQELRVDGRGLFDLRRVTLSFGRYLPPASLLLLILRPFAP